MQYLFFFVTACMLLVLTGCNAEPDYTASAECQAQGNTPGTKAYDDCLMIEKMNRLRAQQDERDKIVEQRKQQQQLLRR